MMKKINLAKISQNGLSKSQLSNLKGGVNASKAINRRSPGIVGPIDPPSPGISPVDPPVQGLMPVDPPSPGITGEYPFGN